MDAGIIVRVQGVSVIVAGRTIRKNWTELWWKLLERWQRRGSSVRRLWIRLVTGVHWMLVKRIWKEPEKNCTVRSIWNISWGRNWIIWMFLQKIMMMNTRLFSQRLMRFMTESRFWRKGSGSWKSGWRLWRKAFVLLIIYRRFLMTLTCCLREWTARNAGSCAGSSLKELMSSRKKGKTAGFWKGLCFVFRFIMRRKEKGQRMMNRMKWWHLK